MNEVNEVFPPVEEDARVLREAIEKMQEIFKDREDIKKLGESYIVNLKKKQDTLPKIDRVELKKKSQAKDKKPATTKDGPAQDKKDTEESKESKHSTKLETLCLIK